MFLFFFPIQQQNYDQISRLYSQINDENVDNDKVINDENETHFYEGLDPASSTNNEYLYMSEQQQQQQQQQSKIILDCNYLQMDKYFYNIDEQQQQNF